MTTEAMQNIVTRELVPEDGRMGVADKIFGMRFVLELEPFIYDITERMAESYGGGLWNFFLLSNGGFYMAPSGERTYHVICDNFFDGDLSADALGITSCLYAYSHLSFGSDAHAHNYADHFYKLREYMMDHPEVRAILSATD